MEAVGSASSAEPNPPSAPENPAGGPAASPHISRANRAGARGMKFLTHNVLRSNIKGARTGFPLGIEATNVEIRPTEFSPEFVLRMLERLDWNALLLATRAAAPKDDELAKGLPESFTEADKTNEEFLRKVHHVLLEIIVVDGFLVCPDTGRKFKIANGIPNMLLREDEV